MLDTSLILHIQIDLTTKKAHTEQFEWKFQYIILLNLS